MPDVFISYSRRNNDFARHLIERLNRQGKDAWVDWEGIPLTAPNWWTEIKLGIEASDSFVFILSPDSMASVVCNLELDYAIELGKRIIPIVYQDIVTRDAFASIADFEPDEAMEERLAGKAPSIIARDNWQRLSHINWVRFRENDNFDEAIQRLVSTVETDLKYVKAHTRYLTHAQEWAREDRREDLLLFGQEIDRAETWLQQARVYAIATKTPEHEKVEVVNPLPQALHREYIQTSRAAADERSRHLSVLEESRKRSDAAAQRAQQEAQKSDQARQRARRTLLGVVLISVLLILGAIRFVSVQVSDAQTSVNSASTQVAAIEATSAQNVANASTQVAVIEATAVRLEADARARVLSTFAREAASQGDRMLGLRLALEATRLNDPPFEVVQTLFDLAYSSQPRSHWVIPMTTGETAPPVNAVAYNPDGTRFLVASRALYEFDAASGDFIREWLQLDGLQPAAGMEAPPITAVAYSPAEDFIAAGYYSGAVVVFDAQTQDTVYRITAHDTAIHQVAFSPNGRYLITASTEALFVWETDSWGTEKQLYAGEHGELVAATVANGRVAAATQSSVSRDQSTNEFVIWSLVDDEVLHIPVDSSPIDMDFSPDGSVLLLDLANSIRIYDDQGQQIHQRQTLSVFTSTFCGPRQHVITLSPNGKATLYSSDLQETVTEFIIGEVAHVIDCHPDGHQLILGTTSGELFLWDLSYGDAHVIPHTWLGVNSEPFDRETGEIFILNADSLQLQAYNPLTFDRGEPFEAAFMMNDLLAYEVTASYIVGTYINSGNIVVWDRVSGSVLRQYEGRIGAINLFDLSADGTLGVSYTPDSRLPDEQGVEIWDVLTGETRYLLPQPEIGRVLRLFRRDSFIPYAYVFSPDKRSIATIGLMDSGETALLLWRFEDNDIQRISLDARVTITLAYNHAGTQILAGDAEGGVTLWDITTGTLVHTLFGLEGNVISLDFSPDGQRATGSDVLGHAVLWDVNTGQILRRINHDNLALSAAFAPDGSLFAVSEYREPEFFTTLYANHTLESLHEWIAANRYVRELSCAQRAAYSVLSPCTDEATPPISRQ